MSARVGPPEGQGEIDAFSDILTDSLNFPPRAQLDGLARYRPADLRLVRAGQRVAGGLVLLPAGQYFGGQRLAMMGIHAVAVTPEERGTGIGRALLASVVAEMAAPGGPPIACLFPATQPLYRSVGFEQAGTYTQYRIPIAALPVGRHDHAIERLPAETAAVMERVGPVYERFAPGQNGFLDRTEWFWRRRVEPLGSAPRITYAVREQDRITGYMTLRRRWDTGGHMHSEVECRELLAETPGALERLLTLLADERSLARSVVLAGPPTAVDHMRMLEQEARVDFQLRWMLRILDAAAALEGRGYPPGLTASIGFEIADDLVAANRGHLTLEVAGGRGRVRRSTCELELALDVRGLASLFSGYAPAEELARAGMAAGSADALAAATAVFAGPAPWLPEIF